jgi:hypothetical protein
MAATNLTTTTMTGPNVFKEAYESLVPELKAMDPDDLIHINLDIPTVVTTGLGALAEIRALRPDVLSHLPSFDIAKFDKLETAAYALSHAQTLYLTATQPPDDLHALSNEAAALRETLLTDARALAHRGRLEGEPLDELKGPLSYRTLAAHLQVLAELFQKHWPDLVGTTSVLPAELDRALGLARRILVAVGQREQGPALLEESVDMRHRAFTLFVQTYDHVRRAVSYLRWDQGDAEQIAPSLYAGRGTGKRKEPKPANDAPAGPSPGKDAPPLPAASSDAKGVNPPSPGRVREPVPVGFPGSNPFMD